MGSGYFPLNRNEETGKELLEIVEKLKGISSRYMDYCAEQDQTDNAMYDGVYIGQISTAAGLIEDCVEK